MRFRILAAAAASTLLAGCMNPRSEATMVQELNSAADEIGGLKSDVGQLQTDLDSLRAVVAHQDTLIARIAAVNNVPITPTPADRH